ncbi:MAG: hypothetical protein ACI4PU_08105 [Intestinibacter sp.]
MKNIINIIEILGDLKDLERKIYLDSPEIFVDFADKIADNQLDEMVLFFATKYDYLSIVEFIVSNKIVDLNSPSKNTQFPTIKDHILEAAIQFGAKDIYDYLLSYDAQKPEDYSTAEDDIENFIKTVSEKLSDLCNQVDAEDNYSSKPQETPKSTDAEAENNTQNITTESDEAEGVTEEKAETEADTQDESVENKDNSGTVSSYEPKFICPNCSSNIFETGYSTLEKVTYKYSKEDKCVKAISKEQENAVTCCKCGYTIEQLNPAFLENISTIQHCKKCGKDLTSTGIVAKVKTEYDNDSNSFITSKKSYHCAECDNELTDYQINYFKL